jgi:hypothetical protein
MSHDPSISPTPSFRVLKAVVVILGIAIVLGIAVIVVTLFNRAGIGTARDSAYRTTIAVPSGDLIDVDAGAGTLVLRYRLEGGAERLVVIDAASGERLGTIDLEKTP